jgi:hypothetical protein
MRRNMLVFSDFGRNAAASRELEDCHKRVKGLRGAAPAHTRLAVLIRLGMVEAAIVDALCPAADRALPLLVLLRQAMDALARGDIEAVDTSLARVASGDLPASIRVTVPEGFAYYALYPAAYTAAVTEWAIAARPPSVVCLGLRSIGTTLASTAAAALHRIGVPVETWTLRPRGHPFDRHVTVDGELLAAWLRRSSTFLVVDEGPGLSGSSLAGTAASLRACGVADDRIVVAAAWNPQASQLRSAAARSSWHRHRVLTAGFDRVRRDVLPDEGVDISAGRWREHFAVPPPWPAAHPQHERVKVVTRDARHIARFAGLGDVGIEIRDRAARLADAGWSAAPAAIADGFLRLPMIEGEPLRAGDLDQGFMAHAADYVAWLRVHECGTETANVEPLAEMLRVNAREALGDDVLPAVERLAADARKHGEPATRIDGRLSPHEWLRTPAGFLKTDALDHHRDHFLPGPADSAWDVAGLFVELDLAADAGASLLDRYAAGSGDRAIAHRLPFYLAAYAAFRLGYCAMAADALAAGEQQRFQQQRQRYADALRRALIPSAV